MIPGIKEVIQGGVTGILDSLTNGVANVISKFKKDPTKAAEYDKELEELKVNAALKAHELSNSLEEIYAKELETVNQTMREEAKSEHWMVWSWRPLIGFTFCGILINNYILLPYFKHYGMEIIVIPGDVWSVILVILGVASAGRGLTKWQKEKNGKAKS